ncbi:MAG: hypothetical protein KBE16_06685 [Alphaproteobacteria bacterium]|jgi:capsule polysaccharide export protein KpsE/RkpR|nr:hypothetical protein [Alphaproteobacteria bacterium]MBP9878405.1 hypothetical protein [Alphaproteobacteria bacterium]
MSLINPQVIASSPIIEAEGASFAVQSDQCPRFVEFLGTHGAFNFKLEIKEMCDRSAQSFTIDFYQFAEEDALTTIQILIQYSVPLSFIIQALVLVNANEVADELKAISLPQVSPKEEKSVAEKVLKEADRVVDQIQKEAPKALDKVEKEADRLANQTAKAVKKGKKKLKKAFKKW